MIFILVLLLLILVASTWLVLEPLSKSALSDPDASERNYLINQKNHLYDEILNLEDEKQRFDLERRAALTLRGLDALPAPPRGTRNRTIAFFSFSVAIFIVLIGSVSFIPRWQLAALNKGEAQEVRDAIALPNLRHRAEVSKDNLAYLDWGRAAFNVKHYDEAITAYANALKISTDQPEALRRLGVLLLRRSQKSNSTQSPSEVEQAFSLINLAARLEPSNSESQLFLGLALYSFGQDDDALRALESYRTLDPKGVEADEAINAIRVRQSRSDFSMQVYSANCASCHGGNGDGNIGPSLKNLNLPEKYLRSVILNGKGAMPAFKKLDINEVDSLVTLIKRWSEKTE